MVRMALIANEISCGIGELDRDARDPQTLRTARKPFFSAFHTAFHRR
jgi:hypothetical protein